MSLCKSVKDLKIPEKIVRQIRDSVLDGTLKPGDSLRRRDGCLASILRIRKTSINEITQARVIPEPSIVRLASGNRSPEDLERWHRISRRHPG